ncbi:MAG: CPBP family intramembrane glutamic endopeptidase [Chitinophagales bacterium]
MDNSSNSGLKPQKYEGKLLAPIWHTFVFILILAIIVVLGVYWQNIPTPTQVNSQKHSSSLPLYLSLIACEWLLAYFVWFGLKLGKNIKVHDLIGGRWINWKKILLDFGIAMSFWIVWIGVEMIVKYFLGPDSAKSVNVLLPKGHLEIIAWILLSISAGICEEFVYRGYLQGQILVLTGNRFAAVLIQGVIFGISHGYQGFKQVIVISVFGIFYGVLAIWRNSLRPNMISHAWGDIFSGILSKFI